MCLAIRYPIEREQLEELHRNLTREQLNNLKVLRDQQQQISQWRDKEINNLKQIQKAQQAMWEQWSKRFENVQEQTQTLSNFVRSMQQRLELKQNHQLAQFEQFDTLVQQRMERIWNDMELGLIHALHQLHTGVEQTLLLQRQMQIGWFAFQEDWQTAWTLLNTTIDDTKRSVHQLQKDIDTTHRQFQNIFGSLTTFLLHNSKRVWIIVVFFASRRLVTMLITMTANLQRFLVLSIGHVSNLITHITRRKPYQVQLEEVIPYLLQ
ncbi:hypothetical protein INT45_007358 [Circinella minor]|uniref:Uncharacterized protein n=1 Tax=Circinella minor TaxID=1195481 RepID=A0A8H7VF50_9FUNG|nr:hypothetical protein INT45_007358 [Circinella minor]